MDDSRAMLLEAPGLPAGTSVLFAIEVRVDKKNEKPFAELTQDSARGRAVAEWMEWFKEELATMGPDLAKGQPYPIVSYRFTASGAGRSVTSPWLDYGDTMDVTLTNDDDEPLANLEYLLATRWGYRKGTAGEKGTVQEGGIPPGGACLLGLKVVPVEFDELPPSFFV